MSLISRKVRRTAAAVGVVSLLFSAAACSSKSDDDSVTMWSNATAGPGMDYLKKAVADFAKANPDAPKIKISFIQNEDYDGKIQTALQGGSSTAPDIFFQRGGGNLKAMVDAGQVQDISDKLDSSTVGSLDKNALANDQIDGKTYAVPMSVLPGGFWYSKDLFKKAGITKTPTTLAELEADNAKLKAKGIAPIAVGGKDSWPAAHWYYWFALRECSQDALDTAAETLKFTDPCFTKAGEDVKSFAATDPFQKQFLSTPAQGATGASGLMATHKAAMELMGAWEPGVIGDLTPNGKPLADLGFFPMVSVPGGEGDQNATMAGSDSYSCSADADPVCATFLSFLATADQESQYGVAFQTIPANTEAQSTVKDPMLKAALDSEQKAPYVSLWFDTLYGPQVGGALNTGVFNLLAGKGSVQDLIDGVNNASSKG